ncbi:MAG: 2-amino-4-hydroxy-6-hydroxymethyldihydropteridine diphosphokinase [Spirochaetales bacterium]|nr:2-amino-4-hydroxy-6-hydroxymethyldihydropteridine diphosphokinase [Spirochaetales bacterium]
MKSFQVYLGIGSNLGDRVNNIESAFCKIKALLDNLKTASLYETKPMYVENQPWFLNTVFSGQTELNALDLLWALQRIEADSGRDRAGVVEKGPRIIDIDILLYEDMILTSPELQIPHPLMHERAFVLIPLLDLNPDLINPISKIHYKDYLKSLDDQKVVKYTGKSG